MQFEGLNFTKEQPLHPSGLTQARWDNPFKTPEERQIVVQYFKRLKRIENQVKWEKMWATLEEAPF